MKTHGLLYIKHQLPSPMEGMGKGGGELKEYSVILTTYFHDMKQKILRKKINKKKSNLILKKDK